MSKLNGFNRQSHYGSSMDAFYMGEWGRTIAPHITSIIESGKYPILIYRGMSGTTTATAIAVNIPEEHRKSFGMVYIRKKNEKSHGNRVEYSYLDPADREVVWVVCDDFISSGTTALEILKVVSQYFDMEIPMDSVRFALSLSERFEDVANEINTLESSLCIRPGGGKTAKNIRRKYARFTNKERKERAEREARRAEAINELGWI